MLTFNPQGFLTPDSKLSCTLSEFQQEFVFNFDVRTKRHELFDGFKKYFQDFFDAIGVDEISVWVNGSFVTRKENPNDIDFVFFLDSELADKFADTISQKFTHPESKKHYYMDAFLLRNYPEIHSNHFFTVSDKGYWFELFTRTRKDRRGHSAKKGFIELKISRHEL